MKKKTYRPWTPRQIEAMRQMAAEGATRKTIAKNMDRCESAISRKLAKEGIKLLLSSWTPEQKRAVFDNPHLTNAELVSLVGRSVHAIKNFRRKHHIKAPRARRPTGATGEISPRVERKEAGRYKLLTAFAQAKGKETVADAVALYPTYLDFRRDFNQFIGKR